MNKSKVKLWQKLLLFCMLFLVTQQLFSQVRGKVSDSSGDPIPGVTIIVKGTTIGTITDNKGQFQISVPVKSKILVFSFVGMKTQEVNIGKRKKLDVVLKEENIGIEDVVVVGYGTQSRVSVTGAVSSIKTDDLKISPAPNLVGALTGRLPGLTTIQNSGQPGKEDIQIYLRGASTTNTKSPLVLLDGVPSDANVLSTLDPNEISSVSVLKDASSTAVFGVRGANGVILITTRRGTSERIQLSISAETGFQNVTTDMDLVDSWDWATLRNQALTNDGLAPRFSERQIQLYRDGTNPNYPNTDWFGILVRDNVPMQRYNINASGGNNKVKYFINAGYLKQNGILRTEVDPVLDYDPAYKLDRYNFRTNLDIKINKWIDAGINVGGYINKINSSNSFGGNGDATTVIQQIFYAKPYVPGPVTTADMGNDINGDPIVPGQLILGPEMPYSFYGQLNRTGYQCNNVGKLNTSLDLKFNLNWITKGLSTKVLVAFDSNSSSFNKALKSVGDTYQFDISEVLQPDGSYTDLVLWTPPSITTYDPITLSKSTSFSYYMNMQWAINYSRKFGKKHNVTGLLLAQRDNKEIASGSSDKLFPYNVLGVSARATYDYNHRYLLEFNAGYNGSEQFAKGHRFGFFPAASIGWVASNEEFMRKQDIITYLKFRISMGIVGNDQISNTRFLYLDNTKLVNGKFSSLGEGKMVDEALIGNPDLTWETAKKQNYGIEMTLFKNFTISTDIFNEDRRDILIKRGTVSTLMGLPLDIVPKANLGKINNKGFEVDLKYSNNISNDFKLSIGGNFSYAKNIIKFMDEAAYSSDYLYKYRDTNQSIGQTWGYTIDWDSPGKGYFTSLEEINNYFPYTAGKAPRAGDFVYKDLNNDGEINTEDYAPIKYPLIPRINYGVNMKISYKGFDISMLFQGVAKASKYYQGWGANETNGGGTYYKHHLQAWTAERYANGEKISYPALASASNSSSLVSNDFFVADRSYLRLKNAEIGYTLPKKWSKSAGMKNVRIYMNGQNLITWDKLPFSHIDPEQSSDIAFPIIRVLNMGINIVF